METLTLVIYIIGFIVYYTHLFIQAPPKAISDAYRIFFLALIWPISLWFEILASKFL